VPHFRVTKKLATALQVRLVKEPIATARFDHEWFADLFNVERRKCVIWCHRTTLLGFVRPAVVAADLREFHGLFRYEFRTALASMALPDALLDRFDVYGPASYGPTDDRSVAGSMLDYRKMFTHAVEHEGGLARADIRAVNAFLNDTPMSVLGGDSAVRTVRRLIDHAQTLH
jgi:hypothetical protein